jgi:hypothetical protein
MATVVRFIAETFAATCSSGRYEVPDDTLKNFNDSIRTCDIQAVPGTCTP